MKLNRTTNSLLAIIALALLFNALNPWLQPSITNAAAPQVDESYLINMQSSLNGVQISLSNIESDVSLIPRQMP